MSGSPTALEGLRRDWPAWAPWLAVVEETMREAGGGASRWDAMVPEGTAASPRTRPRLSGARLSLDEGAVRGWLERLARVAARGPAPKMATVAGALAGNGDAITLFEASLRQDTGRIDEIAARRGADPEGLQALGALVAVPFLHACNRRWAPSASWEWAEPYCAVCGAWPAFAEVLGAERSRQFRCGRCGGAWPSQPLCCPYCANTDHDLLLSLVPENARAGGVIEACGRCLGYLKAFTTLQGCAPEAVMLEDLASVDFDVAALEQGYRRPAGPARLLDVTVTAG